MRTLLARGLAVALGAVLVSAPARAQDPPKPRRGDQTKITRADLDVAGSAVVTAYDAVRLLRPRWLQPPIGKAASSNMLTPGGGNTSIVVYIDDIRQPDVETSLNRVKASDVVEMKYLDQNKAVEDYGPGHEAGVIEVKTTHR
ncbi:MAG TPA: hypothetical protein VG916_04120 [Gemmatimonadaceae bacterium]|nr:hypothetical protein [Gemmatimonadaceae bacterium]